MNVPSPIELPPFHEVDGHDPRRKTKAGAVKKEIELLFIHLFYLVPTILISEAFVLLATTIQSLPDNYNWNVSIFVATDGVCNSFER